MERKRENDELSKRKKIIDMDILMQPKCSKEQIKKIFSDIGYGQFVFDAYGNEKKSIN